MHRRRVAGTCPVASQSTVAASTHLVPCRVWVSLVEPHEWKTCRGSVSCLHAARAGAARARAAGAACGCAGVALTHRAVCSTWLRVRRCDAQPGALSSTRWAEISVPPRAAARACVRSVVTLLVNVPHASTCRSIGDAQRSTSEHSPSRLSSAVRARTLPCEPAGRYGQFYSLGHVMSNRARSRRRPRRRLCRAGRRAGAAASSRPGCPSPKALGWTAG